MSIQQSQIRPSRVYASELLRVAVAVFCGAWAPGCASPDGISHRGARVTIFAAPASTTAWIDGAAPSARVWAEVLEWGEESALCIRAGDLDSFVRCKQAWFSDDGWHGCVITDVAWSPGGRYVAFQMESSGGHQPYSAPIAVLDVSSCESVMLADLLLGSEAPSWVISPQVDAAAKMWWDASERLRFWISAPLGDHGADTQASRVCVYDPRAAAQTLTLPRLQD